MVACLNVTQFLYGCRIKRGEGGLVPVTLPADFVDLYAVNQRIHVESRKELHSLIFQFTFTDGVVLTQTPVIKHANVHIVRLCYDQNGLT